MKEFGVAGDTVRDAVNRLARDGLVTPMHIGTVVEDIRPVTFLVPTRRPAADSGPRVDRVVEAGWVAPDRDITARLSLPAGEQVVHRVRHQLKGKYMVAQIMEQWIPDYVAHTIEARTSVDLSDKDARLPTDLFSLMRQAGTTPVFVTERVASRRPDPDEADLMGLPPRVSVLITHRVTLDDQGVPLETATLVSSPGIGLDWRWV